MVLLAVMISLFLSAKFLHIEDEELNSYLTRVSKTFLYQDVSSIKRHSAPEDIAEVGEEGTIFFVYDQNETPIAVLKKYYLDNPSFKKESGALAKLNAISFQEFHPVCLLGTSEDLIDGEPTGVLILDVAKGHSLNHYLKEISHAKYKKRERLLSQLERGMEKVAMGLSELHKKGYVHGDTHIGNIFYDAKTDTASFIDFSKTKTHGPVEDDLAELLLTTEVLSSYFQLSDREIERLSNSFLKTYLALSPNISSDRLAFYRHNILLEYTAEPGGEMTAQGEYFYNYCKEALGTS